MSTIKSYEKSGQGSVDITIDISFSSNSPGAHRRMACGISSERESGKTERCCSMQGSPDVDSVPCVPSTHEEWLCFPGNYPMSSCYKVGGLFFADKSNKNEAYYCAFPRPATNVPKTCSELPRIKGYEPWKSTGIGEGFNCSDKGQIVAGEQGECCATPKKKSSTSK